MRVRTFIYKYIYNNINLELLPLIMRPTYPCVVDAYRPSTGGHGKRIIEVGLSYESTGRCNSLWIKVIGLLNGVDVNMAI